ncbi:MAG: DNA repair protein RecO, partial [Dehalococcoidales bacterium]|nr:DNA repair protein RecO [Dehalococcoidales bacterium]
RLLLDTQHPRSLTPNRELLLRQYEIHLLGQVGYRPQLRECVMCRKPLQPTINYFSPGAGGILCPDCRLRQNLVYSISVDALKVLRWLQDSDFDTVSRLKMEPGLSRELEMVNRNYIRYLLEREVKSVAWLDSLREPMSPGKY